MKKVIYSFQQEPIAQATYDLKDPTSKIKWKFWKPWDLMLPFTYNDNEVDVMSGDNDLMIHTFSDLKIKIFGKDTWVVKE